MVHAVLLESMQTVFIGTTPFLLSSANKNRRRFTLEFTPSSEIAGNTGSIYFGRGFVPNAVKGDPNQGDLMNAGSVIDESKAYEGDTLPYKGMLWAVADTADQQCTYDEEADAVSPTQATATL